MKPITATATALALVAASSTSAEPPISFDAYLAEMDRTPVSFEGHIYFDPSSTGGGFGFLRHGERGIHGAVIDAGRAIREEIEANCQQSSFMVDRRRTCAIEGTGTVEIRGAQVYLSIDTVTRLEPPPN
ncbi:MAG: hypothetical protein JJU42_00360 [Rhodobacteraceae bacterium]|nr:hypothetical protein [Paracoccaceae bacterium]